MMLAASCDTLACHTFHRAFGAAYHTLHIRDDGSSQLQEPKRDSWLKEDGCTGPAAWQQTVDLQQTI